MHPLRLRLKNLSPGTILITGYAVAILTGGILLTLPVAAQGQSLSFLDGLFTATSAMCVTGLAVVDTGTRFSLFGQLVILTLIQVGGLGITTFSVYLFFYLRLGVGIRGRWILHETLLHTPVDSMRDLVRSIFRLTLAIEGVGAVLLAVVFIPQQGVIKGAYYAVFHSVSAFCNAGFALFPDSLIGYRNHPLVNLTIMGLIILGGIGFLVMREVAALTQAGTLRRRMSLHSKLVLLTSTVLIFGGALVIGLLEWRTGLRGMSFWEGFWTAMFQSVTARTAGFNTIDLNLFGAPTIVFMIFLMFIGASPGSCGGGIKTTSLAIFFSILHSRLKGIAHTNVFRRTLPEEVVTKTLSLVMLAMLLVGVAVFALLAVHGAGVPLLQSRGYFMDYFFEAVSAFGTVGLSLGITPQLSGAGKVIIILLMFIGRVGLLTVAFTIARRSRPEAVRYGEENIMIG